MSRKIRNERELIAFFNRRGIANSLKFFANLLMPNGFRLNRFHVNFKGASYTNMKDIEIGIPDYAVGWKESQVLMDAKWRTCHEVGHILYTPDKPYRAAMDKFVKYFNKKYGFNEALLREAANAILNGMEDGREEARFLENHPQSSYLDYFRFGRANWYSHQDFSKGQSATDISPAAELFDGLFCLCTLATMGNLPLGWAQKWNNKSDLYQLMTSARKYVDAFVSAKTFEDGDEALWQTIQHIENWLVDLMKKIPVQQVTQTFQQAQQAQGGGNAAKNNTGNSSGSCAKNAGVSGAGSSGSNQSGQGQGSGGGLGASGGMNNASFNSQTDPNAQNGQQNQAGQSGGQGTQAGNQQQGSQNTQQNSGQNGNSNQNAGDPNGGSGNGANNAPASPLHEAFAEDQDASQGGRITRMNDEYDGDYGTDMQKIVKDAMREAETSLGETEENAIMQADWEDVQAEEAARADVFDEKAAQEVQDYYKTINPNKRGGSDWNVGFKRKTYDLPQSNAPKDILGEAKNLNQEFAKILLNKRAFNSSNRRRGILNTNDLYKLALNQQDLFKKKGHPKASDFVFYVLMDGSGSMSGKKFREALRACSLIEESLRGIAPVKVAVFDYSYGGVVHHIIKDFKEVDGNRSWAYYNTRCPGGCNMDGYSIRVAANELLKRGEGQKVLITLSDGQPNGPYAYSGDRGENDVGEAVFEARKKGINVFNIFFAESTYERQTYLPSFVHMYRGKGIVSCEPKDIGMELLRVVRRELVR